MKTIQTKQGISDAVMQIRAEGKKVGFVPTMGALHRGHISLVERCISEGLVCVASIFVNPTQFNDKEDLKKYPRTLEADLDMLSKAGCSLVFAPDEKEMYPEEDIRVFDFGNLDKVMEGAHRPGHFNGVGQIVSKLFDAVKPDAAYFGEKDFQQLAIIKKMVKDMGYAIRIVPCPIVREADGLAMSSRNMRLSPDQRREAVSISKTLFRAKELWSKTGVTDLKKWVVDELSRNPAFRVEYFDIVDDVALQSVNSKEEKCGKVGCIAVQVGAIRLIDNIRFE